MELEIVALVEVGDCTQAADGAQMRAIAQPLAAYAWGGIARSGPRGWSSRGYALLDLHFAAPDFDLAALGPDRMLRAPTAAPLMSEVFLAT